MTTDTAIIGGGLAGAALAIRAASAGRRVTVIEREGGAHDKVCGEFLSHEALLHLRALDIDPLHLGGHPIDRVRIACGRAVADAALPFEGIGLSRRVLDEALLHRAADSGARLHRGRRVLSLDPDGAGHRIRLEDGDVLRAENAILATGKHDLRGWRRAPGRQNDLVGFKLHLRLTPPERRALAHHVELTLFRSGYAGLQLVEHDQATLCLLVRRARLNRLGGGWPSLLASILAEAPLLRRRLDGAEPLRPRPLGIAGIPYGLVARPHHDAAHRVWRLGDQAAVIPSFTGDGMSIALHSAALAAASLAAGGSPAALQTQLRRDVGTQVAGAALVSLCAVRRPMQRAAIAAARHVPSLATLLAAATRIPDAALRRGLAT